jgi:FkbM family methyltransferase
MRGQSFVCSTAEKYFYLGSHLEEDGQKILLEILRPGEICYDIGAHVGYMSLLFAAIVGSAGQVFSFEPSPINYLRVRHNIERNGVENIAVLNLAASDREGEAVLEERGSMSTIVKTPGHSGGTAKIHAIRLDDFAYRDGNPPPSFVKLDVEGQAGPALDGMRRIFEVARPKLMCELHNSEEEGHVTRFLSSCRYTWSVIDHDHRFPRRVMSFPK